MNFIEENKKSITIIVVLIILSFLITLINNLLNIKNDYKYIENKDYVYLVEENNGSRLPFININSEQILEINDKLKNDYYEVILYEDCYMNYEYSIHDNYLSIIIEKGIKKNEDDFLEIEYSSYNISIKEKRLLTITEVLDMYSLTLERANNIVENSLREEYNSETKEGYIPPEECNYACYLEERNYLSADKNLQVYVDNNKNVKGYLNITRSSLYYIPTDVPNIKTIFSLN